MALDTPQDLERIDFGLMDPESYRDISATKVITADTYDDDGFPIDMGLMDPRLGVIDPGLECKTCGKHSGSCNGHFGHIELAAPVIHVGFAKLIRRLLRGTCRECSRVLLTEEEQSEFRDSLDRTRSLGRDVDDVTKSAIRQARKKDRCPHCGEEQFDIQHEKPTTYYEVQDVLASDYPARIAGAMEPDEDSARVTPTDLAKETGLDSGRIREIISGEFRPRPDDREMLESALGVELTEEDMNKLMASDIRDWFEHIPDSDIESIGIDAEGSRPEWMILTVLPVPPVTARPSITLDNGQRSEDDLTHKLVDIIRINQRFMENRERCPTADNRGPLGAAAVPRHDVHGQRDLGHPARPTPLWPAVEDAVPAPERKRGPVPRLAVRQACELLGPNGHLARPDGLAERGRCARPGGDRDDTDDEREQPQPGRGPPLRPQRARITPRRELRPSG